MIEQLYNTKVYAIDELRNIVLPFVKEHSMCRAGLLGSNARGEADRFSDIDAGLQG